MFLDQNDDSRSEGFNPGARKGDSTLGRSSRGPRLPAEASRVPASGRVLGGRSLEYTPGSTKAAERNTHKVPEPVCERVVPTYQILAFPEQTNIKDWMMAPAFMLPESQSLLKFEEVAIYFSQEEGELLDPTQKALYNGIMHENYETVISLALFVLPKPKVIFCLEQEEEPYIQGSPVFKDNPGELLSEIKLKNDMENHQPMCLSDLEIQAPGDIV